jgi:hypothetical protein
MRLKQGKRRLKDGRKRRMKPAFERKNKKRRISSSSKVELGKGQR